MEPSAPNRMMLSFPPERDISLWAISSMAALLGAQTRILALDGDASLSLPGTLIGRGRSDMNFETRAHIVDVFPVPGGLCDVNIYLYGGIDMPALTPESGQSPLMTWH